MDKLKRKYLKNLAKRKRLEAEAKKLAWQIVPDDIKEILCGPDGIYTKRKDINFYNS